MGEEFGGPNLRTPAQHNRRQPRLTPPGVGHADDRDVRTSGCSYSADSTSAG